MNLPNSGQIRILIAVFIFTTASSVINAQTITPRQIEQIRSKSVLTEPDLTAVTTFVNEQLNAMMTAAGKDDNKALGEALTLLTDNSRSKATHAEETMGQYSQHFNNAVRDGYSQVLEFANTLKNPQSAQQLQLAMMTIIANTDSPDLVPALTKQLKSDNPSIRYLAMKGLIQPKVLSLWTSSESNNKAADEIKSAIDSLVENVSEPTVMSLIIRSAAALKNKEAVSIIQKCIAKRLPLYQNWTVTQENLDLEIIRTCCELSAADTIKSDTELRNSLLKSAVELFSAAYSLYAKGFQYDIGQGKSISLFDEKSESYLQSLLVFGEIELMRTATRIDNTIRSGGSRFLKVIQAQGTGIDKAYELDMRIFNKAFAMFPEQTGQEPKYFDPMPDPPQEIIQRAKTRSELQGKLLEKEF